MKYLRFRKIYVCSTAFQHELYIVTEKHVLERDDSVREHFLRQLPDIPKISVINYTCLKRVLHIQQWSNFFFAFALNEVSFENRCTRYWIKYLRALESSTDGDLLIEQLIFNSHREAWLSGKQRIFGLRRSKRFVDHEAVLQKCFAWYDDNPLSDTIAKIQHDDIELLRDHPETF